MTHTEIIFYCLQKPGAYLDYPFDPLNPVVKVRSYLQKAGRIFAQPFMLRGESKVTLNCTPASAEFYRNKYPKSITRGWHCPPIQQPHFNTINLDGTVPDDEILQMIDYAYDVVISKMPKYVQNELKAGGFHL
jgi:predicted DNA-binding protein (MmcQ/YjbR family)